MIAWPEKWIPNGTARISESRQAPPGAQAAKTKASRSPGRSRWKIESWWTRSIYQHAYPNPNKDFEFQKDGAIKPADVFKDMDGFRDDLKLLLSEFNIGIHAGAGANYGVNQGALWIEEFGRYVDAGVDAMDHWGLAYNWLTTKFYDTKFPPAESDGGAITAIATPMGQIYDLASSHLIGKTTISDTAAAQGMKITGEVGITGFAAAGERFVFLSNTSGKDAAIDLSGFKGQAVFAHHIIPADSRKAPGMTNRRSPCPRRTRSWMRAGT